MIDSTSEPTEETRPISKAMFATFVFGMMLALVIIEMIALESIGRVLGFRPDGRWLGGLHLLNLILAVLAVDGILKRFGRSLSGKTLEVRGRTVAIPEGDVLDDEVVEVRCPRSTMVGLGLGCLALSLIGILILAFDSHDRMIGDGWSYALLAFPGIAGLYCLYGAFWGEPQARADASGIMGHPANNRGRRKFVPWSKVATCEIETHFNTFGEPIIIRPTLKGFEGEPLLTPNLSLIKIEDQERLVKYIQAKLPKPKDDHGYWE